jgi:3-polyprenyl-4-hydroxybenzoate decarboxylase
MKTMNHAEYQVKHQSEVALRYTIKDAQETIAANPFGENAGYYADESINTLGKLAGDVMSRAAIAYLKKNGKLTLASADALEEPLKRHSRIALPQALEDAKAALDCGMRDAAQLTFKATLALAGIAAAKEVAGAA